LTKSCLLIYQYNIQSTVLNIVIYAEPFLRATAVPAGTAESVY